MDHQRHHDLLIARARNRSITGYIEKHHVIPRCMGGTDNASNLVSLTAEEHYLIHILLAKLNPNIPGLMVAVVRMSGSKHKFRSNKLYGWLRKRYSASQSAEKRGCRIAPETRAKLSAALRGRAKTPEHIRNAAQGKVGKKMSESHKAKMSAIAKARMSTPEAKERTRLLNLGKKMSPEAIEKMRVAKRGVSMSPEARAKLSETMRNLWRSGQHGRCNQ